MVDWESRGQAVRSDHREGGALMLREQSLRDSDMVSELCRSERELVCLMAEKKGTWRARVVGCQFRRVAKWKPCRFEIFRTGHPNYPAALFIDQVKQIQLTIMFRPTAPLSGGLLWFVCPIPKLHRALTRSDQENPMANLLNAESASTKTTSSCRQGC
jgi:hypothetical protein